MGQSWPLFHLFSSFQTRLTIFTTNKCERVYIQYLALGFELTTFGTCVSSLYHKTSGQSYKHFMLINYNSGVVPDLKIPHITTLES